MQNRKYTVIHPKKDKVVIDAKSSYEAAVKAAAKWGMKNTSGITTHLMEDAPANATGTAVAGTGDDSSTVIVKKKKHKQDKLMRRMGITETINRVIPDLEYEADEIEKRANQLKELALKSEGERALARDKSTDQPKKYVSGLSAKDKKAHDKHLEKQNKKSDSDKSAYKQSPADKKAKTKTSAVSYTHLTLPTNREV